MNRFVLVLIAVLMLAWGLEGRRHKEELAQQVEPEKQKDTVLEANHFMSNTETKTAYNINDLIKDKPLLFILKQHKADSTDKLLEDNPITITLKEGSNSKSCTFNSYTNLCAIPKVSSDKGSLEIQCKKTPCELSWEIIQPGIKEDDGNHGLDNLVSVNKDKNHAAVEVLCDSPEIPNEFSESLVLYTNSKYKKQAKKQHAEFVWFLFDNEQQGYYYLTSKNDKIKQCANVSLTHMNDDIEFNNQKDLFKDFLQEETTNNYQFKSIPKNDFRIEADVYDINQVQLNNDTSLTVSIVGYKNKAKVLLNTVDLVVDNERSTLQFNVVFKKPTQKYDSMDLQLTARGQLLVIEARFVDAQTQQVNLGQLSEFNLKKGQTIKYNIIPLDKNIQGISQYKIFPKGQIKTSVQTCPTDKGCDFTVQALENGQGSVYIGDNGAKGIADPIIQGFEKRISAKLHPGETRYYSHKIKNGHALQLLINVPNVVVFAANKDICSAVDFEKCHQISFNHHFPAIYEPKGDGELLFLVRGLDSVEFTLTVMDENTPFVQLKDSQPFTYLFDNKQNSLVFEFIMKEKQDVSFNLIGPTNELNLYVLNEKKAAQSDKIDWTGAELSSDGFIKINKDDIKGLDFAIKVEKRPQFAKKYAHFTVIASTKESNLHLSTGSPHYQTLKVKDSRDYYFQFSPKARFYLNFYTHNLKHDIKINLKLSNADQYNNKDNIAQFIVDKYVDTLDLSLPGLRLCKQNEGANCELYMRVENMMDVEVDVTITLMVEQATVELKDGIWQSYAVNEAVVGSHFYFLPKHPNHSATIFYQPSSVDLKIFYTVWTADDLSVDVGEWPFPETFKQHQKRLQFKPLQYIHIQPEKLKTCWPNCVILMSLLVDEDAYQDAVGKNQSAVDAHFRIMATNNYIEIPIKHKVDVLLAKNQTKQLLVDLKYYLQKQQLNFYTHHTMGNAKIKANVYSETNPRCPTIDDDADFTFDDTETTISVEEIKKQMEENSMGSDKNIYLCLLASASQSSKFNIEFNTNNEGFRKLKIDTTTTIKAAGKTSLYYLDNSQEIYLKISRNQGFPFCDTKLCKPDDDIAQCFDSFTEKKGLGEQLAEKVTTFAEKPCPKCILLVKITTREETQLILHAQSKYNQIELSANTVLTDSLEPNEENKYTLTGTKYEEIIINIQIFTGNLKVAVHDFEKVDISKTNDKGSKNIHITIPPKDLTPEEKALGTSHMSSFGLSSFVHLHIVVESQEADKSAAYSITYSVGSPVVFLQDGLITEYSLISKKQTKFIFKNPSLTPIYLYTSTSDVENLKNLNIKYKVMSNEEDEDAAQEITPEKADFQKKTVNPTHFALLPAKQNYFFIVTNENAHNTIFTIGVNKQQIIYLPFDREFPLQLGPKQHTYLVLNPLNEGFVKMIFNKCSLSRPFLGYTTSYDDFIKEEYQMQDQMGEQLSDEVVLKVKKDEGLYIKVQSQENQATLISVKAVFSPNKIKVEKPEPGNQGLLQYQLLSSSKAEISFDTLVCQQSKNCKKDYTYTALSSNSMQNVYSQLVCPSIMFSVASFNHKLAKSTPITSAPSGSKIIFSQELDSDLEYVGVRAVNSKTGDMVYYQPIEIVTFWGEIHRSSATTMMLAVFMTLIFGCGCLIIYRRYRRNQYSPLNNEFGQAN